MKLRLTTLAALVLATPATAGDVRLMWYSDGVEGAVIEDLLARFMAENPGINVILDNVAYQVIQEQLPIQLQAGQGPDIARVTNLKEQAPHWLDLTPYLQDPDTWRTNFADTLDWMRPDGSDAITGFMTQLTLTGGFANATLFGNSSSFLFALYGFIMMRTLPKAVQVGAFALAAVGTALMLGNSYELSPRHFAGDLFAILAGFFYFAQIERLRHPVQLFDAIGLGFFAVSGAEKALAYGLGPSGAVLLGILSGIGGGIARDLLVVEVPSVLRRELYAVAALLAAGCVVVGDALQLPAPAAALTGALACITLRMLAVNRDIMMRTACVIAAFSFFAAQGARAGDAALAANAVLQNFVLIGSFFLDGMATAAEQLCGRSLGARDRAAFRRFMDKVLGRR